MARRLCDRALAAAALIALAPLLAAAAIGIKCSSRGPVLYRARRAGRAGVIFTLFKFRTMHASTEAEGRITAPADARVFPLGRWLRACKVDELPQLVNVLLGDMAVIGPRPEDPDIVRTAYGEDGWATLAVAPGLASPGSIYNYTHGDAYLSGDADRAYVERLLPVKLALDRVYVERASLAYDARLIVRTLFVLAARMLGRRRFAEPPEMSHARRRGIAPVITNRVLAHAHSTWSYDGRLTLEDWRGLAIAHGIGVVLLAEHEETGWTRQKYAEYVTACSEASTGGVRLVPGVEFNQDGFHVLAYGVREWPQRPSDARTLAAAVHEQGAALYLAHPSRYRWQYPAALLAAIDGVEVWNSSWVCDGTLGPHPKTLALARTRLHIVGQDVHKVKHLSGLVIETASGDVLADLRAGRFDVRLHGRSWTTPALERRFLAVHAQRYRTLAVRFGLTAYRRLRRVLRAIVKRQPASVRVSRSGAR